MFSATISKPNLADRVLEMAQNKIKISNPIEIICLVLEKFEPKFVGDKLVHRLGRLRRQASKDVVEIGFVVDKKRCVVEIVAHVVIV